jgi:Transglutaminase-like superfamily
VRGVSPRTFLFEATVRHPGHVVMEYFLSPHVFLCSSGRYVVILDVRRDRYSCLPRDQFELLAPWLDGWGAAGSVDRPVRSDQPEQTAAELARTLLLQGILTLDRAHSKPARPVSVPAAKPRLAIDRPPSRLAVSTKSAAFFLACRRASTALERCRFETVVAHVKSRHSAGGRPRLVTAASKARAIRLAAIFDALRLWYPRAYLCTFDSLALLEFLAWEGIHARWIFAVRADPFGAHCWVQYGETLLNDSVERVTRFTPIMAV